MGDPRFDLANFAGHHELDDDGQRALLRAYHEREPTEAELAAVRLLRLIAAFWEAMWGVLQSAISELDFDFARLRRRAPGEGARPTSTRIWSCCTCRLTARCRTARAA